MDTKKVIGQLVKIAEKQQRIINKLAQNMPVGDAAPMGGSHEPPPNELKPAPTQKESGKVLLESLDPVTRANVDDIFDHRGILYVRFKEGKETQSNYNAVLKVLQGLTQSGKIQQAYELKVAANKAKSILE